MNEQQHSNKKKKRAANRTPRTEIDYGGGSPLGRSGPIVVIPPIVPYLVSVPTLSYQPGFVALFRSATPYRRFLSAHPLRHY